MSDRCRAIPGAAAFAFIAIATACAAPPAQEDKTEGPGPTTETLAIATWAHTIDGDSVQPVPCAIPEAAVDEAQVSVQRPSDSSAKIIVNYGSGGGRATEHYYALRDTLRLFIRIDERYGDPTTGLQPSYNEDSIWLADGSVARWVDSTGFSHGLSRESVGYRAENVGELFGKWLRAVRNCR